MNYNTDQTLWNNFKQHRDGMPYLGAILTVKDGSINDGIQILAQFSDSTAAECVLATAGMKSLGKGQWK